MPMATGRLVGRDTATRTESMMQSRFAFLLISILGCLLLGGLFALTLPDPSPVGPLTATATETATPTATATLGLQHAILLNVIDSRMSIQPRLEGCWVLTFTPQTPKYYWVGFSTSLVVPTTGSSLESYFNHGPTPDDRAEFTKAGIALLTEGSIQPAFSVTIDRALLAELVTLIGGITADNQHLNGEALLAYYDSLPADQQLSFQMTALQAFVRKAQTANWTKEMLTYFSHRYQDVSPEAEELLSLAQQALPYSEAEFNYTLWSESDPP